MFPFISIHSIMRTLARNRLKIRGDKLTHLTTCELNKVSKTNVNVGTTSFFYFLDVLQHRRLGNVFFIFFVKISVLLRTVPVPSFCLSEALFSFLRLLLFYRNIYF